MPNTYNNCKTYHVTPRDLSFRAGQSQCAKEVRSSVRGPGTIPKASEGPVVVQSPFSSELCVKHKRPSHKQRPGLEQTQSKTNSWVLTGWVRRCWWRRFPAALHTGLCTKPGATSGHVRGSRPQTARCISGQPLRKSHPALSACPSLVPGQTAVRRDVNTLVSEEGKDQEVNTMIYYTALFSIFFLWMKTAQLITVSGNYLCVISGSSLHFFFDATDPEMRWSFWKTLF